jgi:hypothetical protein
MLSKRNASYDKSDYEFAVADTGSIKAVTIIRGSDTVLLERTSGEWLVNGGKTRKESLRGLNTLVSRIEAEAPASRSIRDRILLGLIEDPKKIAITLKDGREKSYRVRYDSLSQSTYMMLDGSDIPFRVSVRGYRQKNLADLYVNEPRYWRDNTFFSYRPGEIHGISLLNIRDPGRSFHMARNESGEFEVAPGMMPGEWTPPENEKLTQYLGYFREVRFERFMHRDELNLLIHEDPDYILKIDSRKKERTVLEFYPVFSLTSPGEKEPDLNLLCGRIKNRDEWVILKYFQVDPLLQDFEYFK